MLCNSQNALTAVLITPQEAPFFDNNSAVNSFPEPGENEKIAEKLNIKNIPDNMICPISHALMTDPVYIAGETKNRYEKDWIEMELKRRELNPLTGRHAAVSDLKLDKTLKDEIKFFLEHQAATTIQSYYRGFFVRKRLANDRQSFSRENYPSLQRN